jgi:hypothetical protein
MPCEVAWLIGRSAANAKRACVRAHEVPHTIAEISKDSDREIPGSIEPILEAKIGDKVRSGLPTFEPPAVLDVELPITFRR